MKLFQKKKRVRYTFQILAKGTSGIIYESPRTYRTLQMCKNVAVLMCRYWKYSPLKVDINICKS